MPVYFIPPTAPLVPTVTKRNHPGFDLFKHYRPWDAGINIFVVNGVVTTDEPDYATVTPDHVYLGGHIHEVSAAEQALLEAAGYSMSVYTPPVDSPPFEQPDDPDGIDVDPTGWGFGTYGTGLYGEGHYGGIAV